MSKCTAAQAVSAMSYWLGYKEKASAEYASTRDKSAFEKNAGSNNYTYAGYLCGVQGQPWCAAQVTTAITDACDNKTDAKAVMYGVWPYVACNQLYDAAPSSKKGRRDGWTPKPGDVVVFGYSTRDHTGMVYAVDASYIYTIEGNSSNVCQKRSYLRTSAWIWGYVRPDYAEGDAPAASGDLYGKTVTKDPELHELSKGCAGPEVKTIQRICYSKGYKGEDGQPITVDGDFGRNTKAAVIAMQKALSLTADGIVGPATWAAVLTKLE